MTAEAIDYDTDALPITIPVQAGRRAGAVTPIRGDLRKAAERFVRAQQAREAVDRRAALTQASILHRPATATGVHPDRPEWAAATLEFATEAWVTTPHRELARLRRAYGTWAGVAEATGLVHETVRRLGQGRQVTCASVVRDAIVRAAAALPSPGAAFVEDVEHMVAAGESLHGIAARLRITPDSVLRQLGSDRHNRPDLAARLTLDDEPLPVPRRDLGKVGAATREHADVPPDTAAAVARLVARMAGRDASAVAAMLGITAALPPRTGRV